jgi:dipeptidyl-peptidase-4
MTTKLTLNSIFSSSDYVDEGFNRPRWSGSMSGYTTLRCRGANRQQLGQGNSQLTATTGSVEDKGSLLVYEILWHDAHSGSEEVLVSAAQLTPAGASAPLVIDDYCTSDDRKKVLIFTNSQKVWRLRTRGAYWVLDLTDNSLRPLCNGSGELMFATFSPNISKVAYVRDNNIYVEDLLAPYFICPLTNTGNSNIINGTFDWVYEEEFHLYCGFRWSPDNSHIAYWQVI